MRLVNFFVLSVFVLFAAFFLVDHIPEINALDLSSSFKGVEYVDNHDGDTFTVNIHGLPSVFGHKIPIRVRQIDAAELNAKGYCERAMAQIAKDQVSLLLSNARRIDLENVSRGSFFRLVADVTVITNKNTTMSLSDHLLQRGYAVPYVGKEKPKTDWCFYKKKLRRCWGICIK